MGDTCPFCRTPTPDSDAAALPLNQKRVDARDPAATRIFADAYYSGGCGLEQDVPRAIELWTDAARLGDLDAHFQLGHRYCDGEGVEEDVARDVQHWQHAAIHGHPASRFMLALDDIAAKLGYEVSLNRIKDMFMKGHATKAKYAEALRGYQTELEETRSP
ncbi:hypothetical protein THAOC_04168 [Thalassiosira oceanica]|uniref:Sel1 repeat family protein n=1 Tax=Thalassiosira oceanica TaxID=159749 RepID=K0TJU5_THAOC|nr:hypothetical protein THAOC_04168 [Thalassiosira oceanica]|eukprot:EJK74171.1 hypothetical protein THAOC_04168 [Thalassiosira oceanica]